mmetsp:Transcript_358/g.1044  ORF Transcript_358/g.1044 Transcript_358/m.1044 type:complete len:236 (-) Transcript_358:142-849(-)
MRGPACISTFDRRQNGSSQRPGKSGYCTKPFSRAPTKYAPRLRRRELLQGLPEHVPEGCILAREQQGLDGRVVLQLALARLFFDLVTLLHLGEVSGLPELIPCLGQLRRSRGRARGRWLGGGAGAGRHRGCLFLILFLRSRWQLFALRLLYLSPAARRLRRKGLDRRLRILRKPGILRHDGGFRLALGTEEQRGPRRPRHRRSGGRLRHSRGGGLRCGRRGLDLANLLKCVGHNA